MPYSPSVDNGVKGFKELLTAVPITEIYVGSTVEELMLIEGRDIEYVLHVDPALYMRDAVDTAVIGNAKNGRTQRE